MLKGAAYDVTLALFAFVIFATTRVKDDDLLILACIPPVFVAVITGFVMWLYALWNFGVAAVVAILLPLPLAWILSRRYSARDLVISIYLAWTLGMVCALAALNFPAKG